MREVADGVRAAVDRIASVSAGKSLSGAAATNHVSKLLRSSAITGAVTTVVITGPDFYRAAIQKCLMGPGRKNLVRMVPAWQPALRECGRRRSGAAIGTAIFLA